MPFALGGQLDVAAKKWQSLVCVLQVSRRALQVAGGAFSSPTLCVQLGPGQGTD